MKNEPTPLFDRSTKTLCEDSLHLCYEAANAPHELASRALARASFSATTMFLEASANACLETLDASPQLADKLDKFPVTQKFEFFAQAKFAKRIDYGSHVVQQINELFAVRNRYVHPKSQRLEWKRVADNALMGVPKTSPSLGIPLISTYFSTRHATEAIRVSQTFIRYVLADLGKQSPRQATAILFSLLARPGTVGMAAGPYLYSHMGSWLESEGISLAHIEHGFHA